MDRFVAQLLTSPLSGNVAAFDFLVANLLTTTRHILEVISVVLFALIVYVFVRLMRIRPDVRPLEQMSENLRASVVSTSRFARQWERIRRRLESPAETEWKVAILEADSLVNDLLRRMGYMGVSMGDRLKGASRAQINSIDALWAAHKVRNMIAHDPESHLVYRQAKEALAQFEIFLREANVLD